MFNKQCWLIRAEMLPQAFTSIRSDCQIRAEFKSAGNKSSHSPKLGTCLRIGAD